MHSHRRVGSLSLLGSVLLVFLAVGCGGAQEAQSPDPNTSVAAVNERSFTTESRNTRTDETVTPPKTNVVQTTPLAGEPSAIEKLVGVRLDTPEGANPKLARKEEHDGAVHYFDPNLQIEGLKMRQHLFSFVQGKLHDVTVIFELNECERARETVDRAFSPGARIVRNGMANWQLKKEYAHVAEVLGACQLTLEKGVEDPDPLVRYVANEHEPANLDHLGSIHILKPLAAQGFVTADKKEWVKKKAVVGGMTIDRIEAKEPAERTVSMHFVVQDANGCNSLRTMFTKEWGEPNSLQERKSGIVLLEWQSRKGLVKYEMKQTCSVTISAVRDPLTKKK